jgi:hypothetical protein
MKKLKLLLVLVILALAGRVGAKEEIKSDTTYFSITSGSSFDAYEPVLLKGTYNVKLVKGIEGSYQLNGVNHPIDILYSNGNWSSSIGSFLPKQSVIVNFDVQVQADLEKITELRALFAEKFDVALNSLINNFSPGDEQIEVFLQKLIKDLNQQLPSNDFDNFKDENGKSLRERLTEKIMNTPNLGELSGVNEDIRRYNNNIKGNLSGLDQQVSTKNQALKDYFDFFNDPESIKSGKAVPNPGIDTIGNRRLRDNIRRIKTNWNNLLKATAKRDSLVREIIPETGLLVEMSFQSNLQETRELTFALKNFIGFDLMPVYFFDKGPNSTFGLFFAVSPYFGRTDPDEKIFKKGDLLGNLRRFITPTLGIGLMSSPKSDKVAPLIYAGAGFRMSNIVRVSIGKTFYTQKYEASNTTVEPTIEHGSCWTIGVGLSTDYLSDFMKIFSTTVNQFGKK